MKKLLAFVRTLLKVMGVMVVIIATLRTLSNDSADAISGFARSYKKLKADQDVRELFSDAGMAAGIVRDYVVAIEWHEWAALLAVAVVATILWTVIYTVPRTAQKRRYRSKLRSEVPTVRRRKRKAGGNDR